MQLGLSFLQQDLQTAACTETGATLQLPDPGIKAHSPSSAQLQDLCRAAEKAVKLKGLAEKANSKSPHRALPSQYELYPDGNTALP